MTTRCGCASSPSPTRTPSARQKRTSNQRRRQMTSLPLPEQWVLCKMSEMEVAEMIEKYIDFFKVDDDGTIRSVHLPAQFVRHFIKRDDGVLPTVVAIATAPIVLADGVLLAPDGLDRERGIQFIIQDE